MSMPGFTAEAAVRDSSSETYAAMGSPDASAKGAVVAPQACVSIGPCRVCVTFRPFPPKACVEVRCPLGIGFSKCVP